MSAKQLLSLFLAAGTLITPFLFGQGAIANPTSVNQLSNKQTSIQAPVLLATAYTNSTLPTLQRGDRGEEVRMLQQILQDNGFLGAANVRLGNPGFNVVDGIFGAVTENAIIDLQQRYNLPVTGVVDPTTWEVLDANENPYRSPLPWQY